MYLYGVCWEHVYICVSAEWFGGELLWRRVALEEGCYAVRKHVEPGKSRPLYMMSFAFIVCRMFTVLSAILHIGNVTFRKVRASSLVASFPGRMGGENKAWERGQLFNSRSVCVCSCSNSWLTPVCFSTEGE